MAEPEMLLIDAAELLHIPRRTAYHAAKDGRLRARRLSGRVWVVSLADFESWVRDEALHRRGRKPGGGTARRSKQRNGED